MASLGTWHQHIYNSPPKQPTPHFVANILGLHSAHQPNNTTTCVQLQVDQPLRRVRRVNEREPKVKQSEQDESTCDSNEKEILAQSKSDTKGR